MTAGTKVEPCDLDASTALTRMRAGRLSAEDLLRSCLRRIGEREPELRAFVCIDAESALVAARHSDRDRNTHGPLHGLPFGVKDIIDVTGLPTAYGSDLPIARIATSDAAAVALLRRAGGIALGKTETVEFAATGRVPPTRNPCDPGHSPGGSSSGSAAAVAAGMVPFALGTQTGGSLVRPASYTGLYALKPSHGLVSLEGVHPHAPSLDCVGWHTRSVSDLALLASVFDLPLPRKPLPCRPEDLRIGVCRGLSWEQLDADARQVFDTGVAQLKSAGAALQDITLPRTFDALSEAQATIMRGEARVSLLRWAETWRGRMHPDLAASLDEGTRVTLLGTAQGGLTWAQEVAASCRLAFSDLMGPFHALVAPAATGEAPLFAQGTGSPLPHRLWSALHVPIVALPAGSGSRGLPIGCQLIGRAYADGDLLAAAGLIDRVLTAPHMT